MPTTLQESRTLRLARARRIAELNRQGMSDGQIAATVGCSIETVRRVLDGPARELRDVG
jgi:transposase